MIRILTIVLLASCVTAARAEAQEQPFQFETAGLSTFWKVFDRLRADQEPTDAEWAELWAAPGYAVLEARERRRASLTRAFRLAFRPSLADSLALELGRSGWLQRALRHATEVAANRDSVTRFVAALTASDHLAEARRRALALLPAAAASAPAPAVSLLLFLDARGYRERLLLDPLYFMRLPDPIGVLAHEFHHYYRNAIARPLRPFGDDLLAWVLSSTESEGVAGLLDKGDIPRLTPEEIARRYRSLPDQRQYFEDYQREYRRSDHWLRRVEDVLERVGRHPDSARVLGARLHADIPDTGRILGAFMASAIVQRRGVDALLSVVGDPFAFWRLYGAIGGVDELPAGLSSTALMVMSDLEKSYIP